MKIGIISYNNNTTLVSLTGLLATYKDISLSVYASDYDKTMNLLGAEIADDMASCIKDAEIIINLIAYSQSYSKKYQELSDKYRIDILHAKASLDMIRCFDIIDELNKFGEAVKTNKALIINGGEPVDIITSYLNKTFLIESYGISRKDLSTVDSLLKKADMDKLIGKVNYSLAGIINNLWLLTITDKKGKDLYPEIRAKFKDTDLAVSRNGLTRDSIRSLKFYGYYHSYQATSERSEEVIASLVKQFIDGDKVTVYLNATNNNSISAIDSAAVTQLPMTIENGKLIRGEVDMPLQCSLAITDYASTQALIVKTLINKSKETFNRTIKLDPYLKSILTLDELDSLIKDIFSIEEKANKMLSEVSL